MKPNPILTRLLSAAILLLLFTSITHAKIELCKLIGDGMVLQRDQAIVLWGWVDDGQEVQVEFMGRGYIAMPNQNKKWKVEIPAMTAGGPYNMTIRSATDVHQIKDILIGDVWLCSGQSNMEWTVALSNNPDQEMALAKDEKIRHFKIPHSHSEKLEERLEDGFWTVCSPETVGDYTAVGYFFARELRKHVDVPIGLINSSWGGSRLEPWMHGEVLQAGSGGEILAHYKKQQEERNLKTLQALEDKHGIMPKEDNTSSEATVKWIQPEYDDANWLEMALPGLWEVRGYEGLDGTGWFRKTVELTAEDISKEVQLVLGKIDDSDISWMNGVKIGEMEQKYNILREYKVPTSALKVGQNVIAVWVDDTGGGGGIYGEDSELYIKIGGEKRSLVGNWKFKIGAFRPVLQNAHNQIPTILYNKMIHPIHDYPIKGVLWYQGESNADKESANHYRTLFPQMISDWRARWNLGDFPFLFVQLANFMAPDEEPTESDWAVLRESQSATLALKNIAQAVIIDIGEADDIHPRNKQDVGLRLSLAARKLAYNQAVVHSGPVYRSHQIKGAEIILSFDHIGSGLWAKDKYGYLKGFAIAGNDGQMVWAKARIEEDQVIVWNPKVSEPKALRYAWGNNPDDANLYNKEGLPASPFRIKLP